MNRLHVPFGFVLRNEPRLPLVLSVIHVPVGTVLKVVNNGARLMVQGTVSLWQLAMNFVVPFCVSSYSAARNEAQRSKGG